MSVRAQNEELRGVLLKHASLYPLMEPADAVKLVYQNEFGGGHLIADRARAWRYLLEEYRATPQSDAAALYEPIGNGIVRVRLAALAHHGLSLEALFDRFTASAARVRGERARFDEKLAVPETLARAGLLPFTPDALAAYLADYRAAGCPPVSHSEAYRHAYRPAYRIVCASETAVPGANTAQYTKK